LRIESSKAYDGFGLVSGLGPVGPAGPVVGELDGLGDGDKDGLGELEGLGEAEGEALGSGELLGDAEGEGLVDTVGDGEGVTSSAMATAADSCPPIIMLINNAEMIF
jgi:hypothetical protein